MPDRPSRETDQATTLSSAGQPGIHVQVMGRPGVGRFVGSCRIGRAPENDLVIDDNTVSQFHAEIVFELGDWWLCDLKSMNGTFVDGARIDAVKVESSQQARLGEQGPAIVLTPESEADVARVETTSGPSDTQIFKRYFTRRVPGDMSARTAELRRVFVEIQRKRSRIFIVPIVILALAAGSIAFYTYMLHTKVMQQRAAASDLFYEAKLLELHLAGLELTGAERSSNQVYREDLGARYHDYLDSLGIYSEDTPEEIKLIYRVVGRFGESEVNVPEEFVQEVLRYIDLWKRSPRLENAMLRAHQGSYGQRIAEIMLQHDMPPEFFYLALQESDMKINAVGPKTRAGIAKGMWQFIPRTARSYGLKTGPLTAQRRADRRDDRHNFEKSTVAAAKYLRRLYTTDAQASGLLVMASYNWGEGNVLPLIRSLPELPQERNFWQLMTRYRKRIPRETYNYVFSIVSAAVIGENPELFGFDFERPFERPDLIVDASSETEEPAVAP